MKKTLLTLILSLPCVILLCQDFNNYNVSFLKPGNPDYTSNMFKKIFKDHEYQIATADLNTGNDTLIAYFGQIMLVKEQQRLFYSAIGTKDSLLFLQVGFNTIKDSLGYFNAELALGLSWRTSDKVNVSIKCNPESKTVLYKWNNKLINNENKLGIAKGTLQLGMDCPDFKIQMLDGNTINLSEVRNKIIVLNWWHTKCGPCIKEIPSLNQIVESYKNRKDIVFLAICNSPKEELIGFLKKKTFSYQQGLSNTNIAKQFTDGYPTHLIIDKKGKVVFYISGGGDNTGNEIKTGIDKLND